MNGKSYAPLPDGRGSVAFPHPALRFLTVAARFATGRRYANAILLVASGISRTYRGTA